MRIESRIVLCFFFKNKRAKTCINQKLYLPLHCQVETMTATNSSSGWNRLTKLSMVNIDALAEKYANALEERNSSRLALARKDCYARNAEFNARLQEVRNLAKSLGSHQTLHNKCFLSLFYKQHLYDEKTFPFCKVHDIIDANSCIFEFKEVGAIIKVYGNGNVVYQPHLFSNDLTDLSDDKDGSVAISVAKRCQRFSSCFDTLLQFANEQFPAKVEQQVEMLKSEVMLDKMKIKEG